MRSVLIKPAYHLVPHYHHTYGDEVADLCEMVGFTPDAEQRLALDAIFAVDERGRSVCFEFCVICARQNLKTALFEMACLGWLFLTDQNLIVWSAHEFATAQEAFRDMVKLCDSSDSLTRKIKAVHRANGDESIELMSGQRLKFKARTKAGGRGLTGNRVVLDEAFALQPSHMGALLPTLSAVPDPQVVIGSSAGRADSDVLRAVRDRARAGGSPALGYLEWCAPLGGCRSEWCDHTATAVGCALDNEDNWRAANPQAGRRITLDYIRAERKALPPEEFARERLGWWDEASTTQNLFSAGRWEAGTDVNSQIVGQVTLGLAVSWDRSRAAIGAAGSNQDGKIHLEPLEVHRLTSMWGKGKQGRPGRDGFVAEVARLAAKHHASVVLDSRGPASDLIPALEEAQVPLVLADTTDVLDGCAALFDAVEQGRHAHLGDPDLNVAVSGAQKRAVGDRFALGRQKSTFDISALEAVTLAAWGSAQALKPPTDVWGFFT